MEGICGVKDFIPGVNHPVDKNPKDRWFIFSKGKLIVKDADRSHPYHFREDIEASIPSLHHIHYLGSWNEQHCFCAELDKFYEERYILIDLRSLLASIDNETFLVCSKALQILDWDYTHQYCGRCGGTLKLLEGERAKICPSCSLTFYPRISPAIIVAITNGDQLLMAHNKRFNSGTYSVIAGFVEPGETFESCVIREVKEEVGVSVKNIRYFGSQPWPFPNSLMVAFTAEYAGGQIQVDGVEIDEADWFSRDKMPGLPMKGSVAYKLVHWFLEGF